MFQSLRCCLIFLALILPLVGQSYVRGIYLTQPTAQRTGKLNYLIKQSKATGINTFVINFYRNTKRYRKNIALVEKNGIQYVARIVMFPHGAKPNQVNDQKLLAKRYKRIQQAVALGASGIQLDYIRFRVTQPESKENAKKINHIIAHVKNMLKGKNVRLEIDIFGEAAHRESLAIGQNARLFAKTVDAICPMVYPSHYYPYKYHSERPYETIFNSLTALRQQIIKSPDTKVIAYIETYNFRYILNPAARHQYIADELRAVRDSHANGWYAWSANNHYNSLFGVLRKKHQA